jgi:hypothetical protein
MFYILTFSHEPKKVYIVFVQHVKTYLTIDVDNLWIIWVISKIQVEMASQVFESIV